MPTLARGYQHPPLARLEVLQAQAQHLAAPQPAE